MQRYSELLDTLSRQAQCAKALIVQAGKKKEALVLNDVAAVESITAAEENLVQLMTELEQERLAKTRRIADDIGFAGELTISEMIERAGGGETAKRLKELGAALADALTELSRLNKLNNSLIETQLNYLGYIINATTTPSTLNNSYTASGSAPAEDMSSRLKFIDSQA